MVRRINYFTSAFIGILGFSMVGEVFQEDDPADKIDDALMVLLGIGIVWWYKKAGYKATSGTLSVIFVAVSLLIKIGAIMIEHKDKEAVGDDIGIVIVLVLALVFVSWQALSLRKVK